MKDEKLWTIAEAAKHTKLSVNYLRSLSKRGQVPVIIDWKGNRFFHPDRIIKCLKTIFESGPMSMQGDTLRRMRKSEKQRNSNKHRS